jgi:hypothetical protein
MLSKLDSCTKGEGKISQESEELRRKEEKMGKKCVEVK